MISNRHSLAALLVTGVVALAVITGCGNSNRIITITDAGDFTNPLLLEEDFDRLGPRTHGQWISPDEGGRIKVDFFSLVIPRGALKEETYITVTRSDPKRATVELGPDSLQFECEVYLQVDLTRFHDFMRSQGIKPTDLNIARFSEEIGGWVALETFYAGGKFDLGDALSQLDDDAAVGILAIEEWKGNLGDGKDLIWSATTHLSRYSLAD
jgi:hypothetical protein